MERKSRPSTRGRTGSSHAVSARENGEAPSNSTAASNGWTVRRPASQPSATSFKRRPVTAERKRSGVRQMDTNPIGYWNAQAKSYDDKIFSSIDEDHLGIIARILDTFSEREDCGPMGRCVDLGCGAGKYLPHLATRFGSVTAYDLSPRLVELARKEVRSRDLINVEVRVKDLSEAWFSDRATNSTIGRRGQSEEFERYGFAVMANVLIAPVGDMTRHIMLRNALDSLCSGGRLLVIVPSLESALYVGMRCSDIGYKGPYKGPPRHECAQGPTSAEGAELLRGVCKRYGVRTKHFLEPEFQLLAVRMGFTVELCEKLTYRWRGELSLDTDGEVPASLHEPGPLPWDWLFVLRKGGAIGAALQLGGVAPAECEERAAAKALIGSSAASLSSSCAASAALTPRAGAAVGRLPALLHPGEGSSRQTTSSPAGIPGVPAGAVDRIGASTAETKPG